MKQPVSSGGRTLRNRYACDFQVALPKYHWLPFLVGCISGPRNPLSILVELGAEMIAASTMLPSRSIRPSFSKFLFISWSAKALALQEMTKLENGGFARHAIQLQAGEVPHGLDLMQSIFHGGVTQIVKELTAVNSQRCGPRIRRPTRLPLVVITSYLLLQLLSSNQLVHPLQKDFAAGLALLVLVLGFGEGQLIHGGGESYAVGDDTIIVDFGELFGGSLNDDLF